MNDLVMALAQGHFFEAWPSEMPQHIEKLKPDAGGGDRGDRDGGQWGSVRKSHADYGSFILKRALTGHSRSAAETVEGVRFIPAG